MSNVQDALDEAEFEAFEQDCLDADGLALVEYAIDMKNRGCTLDLTGHGRRLQQFVALSLGSNGPPESCPWDDMNDIVNDIDTVCCDGDLCDGSHAPTDCNPGCAVAMHEFQVNSQACGRQIQSVFVLSFCGLTEAVSRVCTGGVR